MLKEQIQRYENIRKSFVNPDKAIVTSKKERMKGFLDLSFNFPIDPGFHAKIIEIMEELKKEDPGHEYTYSSMLHCTVKSVGLIGKQIDEKLIPEVIEKTEKALKDFPSFEVELRGINTFPVATFIQVFSEDNKLFDLHNKLNSAIPYSEYPEFEGKGYNPHVAIIYFYHKPIKLFAALNKYKDIPVGKMKVREINLIKGRPERFIKMEAIKNFQLK